MWSDLQQKLHGFQSLSLKELTQKAWFMKRIEKKFLLTEEKFLELLEHFSKQFDILAIENKKIFSYDNIYMDTKDYDFYYQHENGDNNRTKVRSRNYKDSENLTFFEYKNKVNGVTHKTRCRIDTSEHGKMCPKKEGYFAGIYSKVYGCEKAPQISPALQTRYKRCTLVHKDSLERLTIDFHIETRDLRNNTKPFIKMENLVIIESKSLLELSPSQKILASHDISWTKSCSKYSLGVIYAGLAERWQHFENTMQEIAEIKKDFLHKQRVSHQKTSLQKTKNRFFKTPLQTSMVS